LAASISQNFVVYMAWIDIDVCLLMVLIDEIKTKFSCDIFVEKQESDKVFDIILQHPGGVIIIRLQNYMLFSQICTKSFVERKRQLWEVLWQNDAIRFFILDTKFFVIFVKV
jgi:hypothetical protein